MAKHQEAHPPRHLVHRHQLATTHALHFVGGSKEPPISDARIRGDDPRASGIGLDLSTELADEDAHV
jgi:hypothetical protein